jgi:hypothetical protein
VLGQFGGGDSFAFGSGTRRLSVAGADVFCEKKERKKKRRKKEKKKKRKKEKQKSREETETEWLWRTQQAAKVRVVRVSACSCGVTLLQSVVAALAGVRGPGRPEAGLAEEVLTVEEPHLCRCMLHFSQECVWPRLPLARESIPCM